MASHDPTAGTALDGRDEERLFEALIQDEGTAHYDHTFAVVESLVSAAREAGATDERERCGSCDHKIDMHKNGGCWYTVSEGRVGENLVCPCIISLRNVL